MEKTTIQITKEVRDKLDLCKGINNLTYNQIIEKLLEQSGGTIVEDVIEIQREQIAFSLKYWEYTDADSLKVEDITYADLKICNMGDVFRAVANPNRNEDFVTSSAKVVYKDTTDVILLVEELSHISGVYKSNISTVHISLF